MSFIEFVGLVISLAAMIFLVLRRVFEEQQRRRNPEEYARKEKLREENLRRLMKSRGIDFGDEPSVAVAKKPVKQARPVQAPVPQQTFVKVQKVLPKSTPSVFQEGDFGRETASAKRHSLAASDLKLEGSYEVIRAAQISPGNRVIDSLRSSRDMLVIKEIFDKPLSMRDQ